MKKKLIIALIILSVVAAGIFYILTTGNIGTKYNTAEVTRGEIEKHVEEAGTISSENIRVYYGNSINRVEKIEVELGEQVSEGQLLLKFEDTIDIEIQKVKKQIEAMEATYTEALSGADFESINSVKIEISSIRNSINLAEENKNRIEELYKNEVATATELEQAVNNLEQLKSRLASAQNSYNLLVKDLSDNMKRKYEAEIDILLLSLESLERNKENSTIYADFDGIITELDTFEGDIPSGGMKILEIQDPLKKMVLIDFMVVDALNIRPGMNAVVNDRNLGIVIENLTVGKIYPKAFTTFSELGVEENRQTVAIQLPESGKDLSFGLKVDTIVMIEASREALFIPEEAIYEKDMKKYVRVLEDGKPAEREVITGIENNHHIEIIEGLIEGEKVILNYEES
ncbi:MAG: Secretion protein HlyD [Clostridiales bacterium 38_11]|nr:MAG: Secretion protein HlyD [Clostridiales bacterium 38_11]